MMHRRRSRRHSHSHAHPATYDALAKRHPLGRVGGDDDVVKGVRTRLLPPARSCTWMEVKVPDTDALRDALDRWKAGIDAHEPDRASEVFTEDAIFQGLRPYSVGR